jgi:hypothetical protein
MPTAAKNMKRSTCVILIGIVALSAVTGCDRLARFGFGHHRGTTELLVMPDQPLNRFRSTRFIPGQIRKVVMVAPFGCQSSFREQDGFAGQFASELRAQGVFDVVMSRDIMNCDVKMITTGKFDERIIARLGREYSADAVLFTQLNSFSAYSPLSAAASFALIDTRESVVLMAADGTWDTRDPAILCDFENFVGLRNRCYATPAYQQSFDEFLSYVATRMAQYAGSDQ